MSRIYRVFFVALFILFIVGGYIMGSKVSNYSIVSNNNASVSRHPINNYPTPTEYPAIAEYEHRELGLLQEKYLSEKPASLTFEVEFPQFHKDWICSQPQYTGGGFNIECRQRDCSYTSALPLPREIHSGKEDEKCTAEFAQREYSRSLQSISITTSEYGSASKISDLSNLMDSSKITKTTKGRYYEFAIQAKEKYGAVYNAVFYSPYTFKYPAGFLSGESNGSNYIYVRYTILATVNGNDITQEKVKKLFEKIIDTTVFTGSDEPEDSGAYMY